MIEVVYNCRLFGTQWEIQLNFQCSHVKFVNKIHLGISYDLLFFLFIYLFFFTFFQDLMHEYKINKLLRINKLLHTVNNQGLNYNTKTDKDTRNATWLLTSRMRCHKWQPEVSFFLTATNLKAFAFTLACSTTLSNQTTTIGKSPLRTKKPDQQIASLSLDSRPLVMK